MKKYTFVLVGVAVAFAAVGTFTPHDAHATDTHSPEVKAFEVSKKGKAVNDESGFLAFGNSVTAGGTIAVCDLDNNGKDEIVVGSGHGEAPVVKVFNKQGRLKREFPVFTPETTVGVNVACGKLNGKKKRARIVVGPGRGGGPQVQVYNQKGELKNSFFAFNEEFRGGVFVAIGKVDKKRKGQQIVAGSGPGGGAHVRIFDRKGNYTGQDFYPFGDTFSGGVSVAVANVDGGKKAEIITAQHTFGGQVKVYKNNADRAIVSEFNPYGDGFDGGINVANVKDIDKDGVHEFATVPRQMGAPHIQLFEGWGALIKNDVYAYNEDYRGGTAIAAGNVDNDSKIEIVTIPQKKYADGRMDLGEKYIEVDLSEQMLYAYELGVKQFEFPISSGLAEYPTPQGITQITAKLPTHDYKWEYGPNHPENYDIKDVPWNLRFRRHYYFHAAYWHNNFGNPMSHGCINISIPNSEKLYKWAEVGTTSWIHP